FELSKSKEARRKGRWTATLLFRAVRRLSERVERVNLEILNWWAQAWFLHVEGFHEARLEIEEVKVRVGSVRELVSVVEK
ncbi:MAG: PaREP1 family protein, partial [Candidatus Methanospirareceae archaeon]